MTEKKRSWIGIFVVAIGVLGSIGSTLGGIPVLTDLFRKDNQIKTVRSDHTPTVPESADKTRAESLVPLLSLRCDQEKKGGAFIHAKNEELSIAKQFFEADFIVGSAIADRPKGYDQVLITCSLEDESLMTLVATFGAADKDESLERLGKEIPYVSIFVDGQAYYDKHSVEYGQKVYEVFDVSKASSIAIETDCYSKDGCSTLYFSVSLE